VKYQNPFIRAISIIVIGAFLCNSLVLDIAHSAPVLPIQNLLADSFEVPMNLGTVMDMHNGTNGKTIIHIQDAHCNYSAQHSVKELINYFNHNYGLDLVTIEGGAGEYDLSPFTKIKDKDLRYRVADHFVRAGRINGAELCGIIDPEKVKLRGLEEPALYKKNLSIYRESLKYKDEVDSILSGFDRSIKNIKQSLYTKKLKLLDSHMSSYADGTLSLKDFVTYLYRLSKELNIRISTYKNLSQLFSVIEDEKGIDFTRCNNERAALIHEIENKASRFEFRDLVMWTIDFKQGKVSADEYYLYLLERGESCGVDISKLCPNLIKYSRYTRKYADLDKYEVFEEIEGLASDEAIS